VASSSIRFPGLLAGCEAAVWQEMGRLPAEELGVGGAVPGGRKKVAKQPPVRKALHAIGLGWVATNTTPFRIAVGRLFDAAADAAAGTIKTAQAIGKKRRHDHEVKAAVAQHSAPPVYSSRLTTHAWLDGPLDTTFVERCREQVLHCLEEEGAVVIRGAASPLSVSSSSWQALVERLKAGGGKGGKKFLRETTGSGVAGAQAGDTAYGTVAGFEGLQAACLRLVSCRSPRCCAKKSILLSYTEGAENWAHQDNNADADCPYQAVLLLSRPGIDFNGGQFYVAKQQHCGDGVVTSITRREVELQQPGDLVIFQAGKDTGWFHGVLPVQRGTASKCCRDAVGLIHPA